MQILKNIANLFNKSASEPTPSAQTIEFNIPLDSSDRYEDIKFYVIRLLNYIAMNKNYDQCALYMDGMFNFLAKSLLQYESELKEILDGDQKELLDKLKNIVYGKENY